jgi:hypothetical protein
VHRLPQRGMPPPFRANNFSTEKSLKFVDTVGQFAAVVVDTCGAPEYLCEILTKNHNGANEIILGPGEDDS